MWTIEHGATEFTVNKCERLVPMVPFGFADIITRHFHENVCIVQIAGILVHAKFVIFIEMR